MQLSKFLILPFLFISTISLAQTKTIKLKKITKPPKFWYYFTNSTAREDSNLVRFYQYCKSPIRFFFSKGYTNTQVYIEPTGVIVEPIDGQKFYITPLTENSTLKIIRKSDSIVIETNTLRARSIDSPKLSLFYDKNKIYEHDSFPSQNFSSSKFNLSFKFDTDISNYSIETPEVQDKTQVLLYKIKDNKREVIKRWNSFEELKNSTIRPKKGQYLLI